MVQSIRVKNYLVFITIFASFCIFFFPPLSKAVGPSFIIRWIADSVNSPNIRVLSQIIRESSEVSVIAKTAHSVFKSSNNRILKNAVVFRVGRLSSSGKVAQVVALGGLDTVGNDRKVFLYYFKTGDFPAALYPAQTNFALRDFTNKIYGELNVGSGISNHIPIDLKVVTNTDLPALRIGDSLLQGSAFQIRGLEGLSRAEVEKVFEILSKGQKVDGLIFEVL